MALPSPKLIQAAQNVSNQMADRDTPFIYNEWYVAAFADGVGRQLLRRTLLDKRVVLFRTEAGIPVALADRCAHRSFPLSRSTLEGDTIVCGYHGFRYDAAGNCIEVPSQPTCPKGIGVKAYPLVERGPLLWIWMGNEAADESRLPPQAWVHDPTWACSKGYMHLAGNYVRLHENLLDLTHLSYLHAKSFGTPDYAKAAFDVEIGQGEFALVRNVVPTLLPPVWGKPTGLFGVPTAARIARSHFLSPAMHEVNVHFYDSTLPAETRAVFHIRTAHLPTPETATSTHYFVVHGRDFATEDDAITHFMHEQLFAAFNEDVLGLSLQEEVYASTDPAECYELSVAADGPAIAMRRYIKKRAEAECAECLARQGAADTPMPRVAAAR